eukprot:3091185-Amphidinium_carterae.1
MDDRPSRERDLWGCKEAPSWSKTFLTAKVNFCMWGQGVQLWGRIRPDHQLDLTSTASCLADRVAHSHCPPSRSHCGLPAVCFVDGQATC